MAIEGETSAVHGDYRRCQIRDVRRGKLRLLVSRISAMLESDGPLVGLREAGIQGWLYRTCGERRLTGCATESVPRMGIEDRNRYCRLN